MACDLRTVRGYDFYEVSSSMQKAIRRGDAKIAGYFALELFHSGYSEYCWKRLLTVSAEDCHGIITQEIKALYDSFHIINKGKSAKEQKGRIFITKAVMILCFWIKNRDSDHLQNFVYDKKIDMTDEEIEQYFTEVRKEPRVEIPDYAFDVHTKKGKMMGKTKKEFFTEENLSLFPKTENAQFDYLIDKSNSSIAAIKGV